MSYFRANIGTITWSWKRRQTKFTTQWRAPIGTLWLNKPRCIYRRNYSGIATGSSCGIQTALNSRYTESLSFCIGSRFHLHLQLPHHGVVIMPPYGNTQQQIVALHNNLIRILPIHKNLQLFMNDSRNQAHIHFRVRYKWRYFLLPLLGNKFKT